MIQDHTNCPIKHFIDESHNQPLLLRATNLWFQYEYEEPVLQSANLEIRKGLVTMILGRSGSGKTTLLKILANIVEPLKGKIDWLAPLIANNGFSREQAIAYIPQSLGLVRNMSVIDNTLAGALAYTPTFFSVMKRFSSETLKNAQQILTDLGIWDKRSRKICNLSGGERQRVAIARALMLRPKLILADEFVAQLDPITTTEILVMMRHLAQRGISFLVTTHDIDLVKEYADRVIIMKEGRILCDHSTDGLAMEEVLDCLK